MESSVLAVVYVVGASLAASSCRSVAYAPAMYSVSSRGITGECCRAREMYALEMHTPRVRFGDYLWENSS